MDALVAKVAAFSRRYGLLSPGNRIVVGVSGGPDSLCLLHVLCQLAPELSLNLIVAHLNHGLRGEDSDADSRLVGRMAEEYGLPFVLDQVDGRAITAELGLSLEEASRQVRYAFLLHVARSNESSVVAVGHHRDDQAETVLMHFLRGSGPAGLRGMLPRTPLNSYRLPGFPGTADSRITEAWLERPLLCATRAETIAYCSAHNLQPRYDLSNEDTTFFRNRLRHELLPVLETYNPDIRERLVDMAGVMAGDFEVLRRQSDEAWGRVAITSLPGEVCFDLGRWRALPLALQRASLREAIRRLRGDLRNVNWDHTEHATWLAREGATGKRATLTGGLMVEVGYDKLRVALEGSEAKTELPQIDAEVRLQARGSTEICDGWRVAVVRRPVADQDRLTAGDPWTAVLDAEVTGPNLSLRPRRPGDRFRPQGMGGHSMKLSEFMINEKIERSARERWPLLIGRKDIVWVAGLRVSEAAAVTAATREVWQVRFEC